MSTPTINAHNSWDKLEEVWLGDIYPASWYDHLPSKIRDCFYEITERTQQDLAVIERKLVELGVQVQRPKYQSIDDYIQADTEVLVKPEIMPRDFYVTIGNTLYAKNPWTRKSPWQHCLDVYSQDADCQIDQMLQHDQLHLSGASTVRVGQDLYFDLGTRDPTALNHLISVFENQFADRFRNYRVHLLHNGGHIDGCFALLKPGLIMATDYFDDYKQTFPGWTTLAVHSPEFYQHNNSSAIPGFNGKWYIPGVSSNRAFNQYIQDHAQTWVGDYTETFFEVNSLVIDPKNIMVLGENDKVFRALEKYHGFTVHSVPFRTRSFWDGGLHCLTVDIRRQSTLQDYFPDRGSAGIRYYD